MDKLAAYEMLLEGHPLWDKEAEKKKYTDAEMAAVGGGALGVGAGGGLVAGRESRSGEVFEAKRDAGRAKHQARMSDIRRQSAEFSANTARRRARSAESSADFWRRFGRYVK
jgi:hypothetical protein